MRALILLLVVLNLGVAAWWAWHPSGPAAEAPEPASGIARLQLLAERGDRPVASAPNASTDATPAPGATPAEAPATCLRIGPFADAAAAQAAVTALQPLATGLRARERTLDAGRGWNVGIAPQADRAAADALAERLRAAGFTDLAIVGEGDGANGIALGRFSSEERARKHESDLKAAGFAAVATPVGEPRVEHWVDGRLRAEATVADARRRAGAVPLQASECPTPR